MSDAGSKKPKGKPKRGEGRRQGGQGEQASRQGEAAGTKRGAWAKHGAARAELCAALQEALQRRDPPELMKKFGYKNAHAGAAIDKIVLNIGAGEARPTARRSCRRQTI